jgi:hypothetical protein
MLEPARTSFLCRVVDRDRDTRRLLHQFETGEGGGGGGGGGGKSS